MIKKILDGHQNILNEGKHCETLCFNSFIFCLYFGWNMF